MDIRTCSRNEIALKIIARRGQGFRSTSDDDHVRSQNSLSPEKLVYRQTNTLIEAAQHRGIGNVRIWRRVEMEDFLHKRLCKWLLILNRRYRRRARMSRG